MSNIRSFFQQAKGQMPYMLTNDYLFRATLQKSNKALKGLICALLHKSPDEITSVEITNPIELGKNLEAKHFVLDIRVQLNGNEIVNLEMQVINCGNWPERSLGYLCRSFDHLNSGQDYMDTKRVHQICFLDFTLFPEYPEFYAGYMFLNSYDSQPSTPHSQIKLLHSFCTPLCGVHLLMWVEFLLRSRIWNRHTASYVQAQRSCVSVPNRL